MMIGWGGTTKQGENVDGRDMAGQRKDCKGKRKG